MSPEEPLPELGAAAGLLLAGAPFVALAWRRAARVLPARPRPAYRWPASEAGAVVALPFVLTAALALAAGARGAQPEGEPDVLLALLASQLVLGCTAGLAAVLAARRPNGLASLGLVARPPRGTAGVLLSVYLPAGLLVLLGLFALWARVCRAEGWEERQEVMRLILELQGGELALAACVAVLVGPLIEELLFRGFLQSFMSQVVGERAALVCSSLLFASMHGVAGLPALFALSLWFGWLQLRTRSLWVPVLAHALNNGVMLALGLAVARSGATP